MDDSRLIQETARAAQAEALLRDVIFQGAIAQVREEFTKQWTGSRPDDVAGREHAYRALYALDEILRRIDQVVQTGAMAKKQLEAQQRLHS